MRRAQAVAVLEVLIARRVAPRALIRRVERVVALLGDEVARVMSLLFQAGLVVALLSALLLQQVETADVILANKCDLASDDEVQTTLAACRVLNEKARIRATTFGDAALMDMLPRAGAGAEEP